MRLFLSREGLLQGGRGSCVEKCELKLGKRRNGGRKKKEEEKETEEERIKGTEGGAEGGDQWGKNQK